MSEPKDAVSAVPCAIIVFARAPVSGQAKTRLIPLLGAQGAAHLQARMTAHALAKARQALAGQGPLVLCAAPDASDPELAALAAQHDAQFTAQSEGDLGTRMHAAFEAFGYPALLMGSDAPCINTQDLGACAQALRDGADAVFLPAEDGGYGLVGLARSTPEIFTDMVWSTDQVMAQTRTRLCEANRSWREIRTIWDVDEPADFQRLAASGFATDGLG